MMAWRTASAWSPWTSTVKTKLSFKNFSSSLVRAGTEYSEGTPLPLLTTLRSLLYVSRAMRVRIARRSPRIFMSLSVVARASFTS